MMWRNIKVRVEVWFLRSGFLIAEMFTYISGFMDFLNLTLFENIFLGCFNETAKVLDSKIHLLVIFPIK